MILFYHIVISFLFLLVLPVLPLVWILSPKRRANLVQRLGIFTSISQKKKSQYRVWVHALSVGEVTSSVPFVRALKKKMPEAEIVFTASTRTGFETAKKQLGLESGQGLVSVLGYFPFDLWLSVIRVASRIEPDLICLVETDLWPGFLSIMKHRGVPVVLINARLSPRSLKGYQKLGRFSSLFFSGLSHVMAQTAKDAQGFEQLGVRAQNLSVTGNIKFDQPCIPMDRQERIRLNQRLGIGVSQRVWLAGSTHKGEEKMVVEAFVRAREICPDLFLIIAPRNPDRCQKLMADLPAAGGKPALFSDDKDKKQTADILFIDTLGELSRAYAVCEFAFIGGSLVAKGGHNPLEPAMFGKPILFGPHMTDFQEVESLLVAAGGGARVNQSNDLARKVMALLEDPALANAMAEASQRVFAENSGALDRIIEILKGEYL
ncbi:MAG: 3-deoxy-D-manno-octulosonic acid transferase [Desulfobacter sp.]|nr:3-deoxy-D-manno-octulosonic acid transferase [Desulfobacter sp.]WDP85516.1 MAG: 3-deoxy-D-manno-octulosonic acid transferase [Desulfobacter sp.]